MGKPARRSYVRHVTVRRRLLVERLGDRRVLAAISGEVFDDLNLSYHREIGEANAPSRLVYVDTNGNAKLDSGETTAVAEPDGTFLFDNLADGTYSLRLFNGSQSQVQTVPVEATSGDLGLAVNDAQQFASIGSRTVALTDQSIVIGDLVTGSSQSIFLGGELAKMQPLPDGNVLVVSSAAQGDNSWIVDPTTGAASSLSFDLPGVTTPWSDVALDQAGHGILLEQSGSPFALRSIDASVAGQDLQVSTTTTVVPADTTALSSDSGNRSVLAWAGDDGLQLSLWSNSTASMITTTAVDVEDATELLAFDDASGLLALRTVSGDVNVLDVDGGFASLHTLDDVSGPVAIDGARDLLVTISSDDAMLKMFSLRDGQQIADLAVDLSTVGAVTSLSVNENRSLTVLGAAGLTEIALRKPSAHTVTITNGQDPHPILFGVAMTGGNAAPVLDSVPVLTTNEDTPLNESAPGILGSSFDLDGDEFVVIQRSDAANGIARVEVDGAIAYTPHSDFHGTDAVTVLLHDGRDASVEMTLTVTVNSVADDPTGVLISIDPVPENLQPGTGIGTIEVIDADGDQNHGIGFADPRFGVIGDQVVFVGGEVDFESEPEIEVAVTVTDPVTGRKTEDVIAFSVADENDPITAITPDTAIVTENAEGGFVAFLGVDDEDAQQTHTLTVDDDRFVVIGSELRLVAGLSLDHETEPTVLINVTAKEDIPNGNSLTEPITIEVGDIPEQPQSIQLSNDTVIEMVPGAVVGEVTIDGGIPDERFDFSVDDSRFEIIESTLKLRDDQLVEYANQSEIVLEITAVDSLGDFSSISETFLIQVIENDAPYHNHDNPYDVDHSGKVTALDALAIINYLNTYGPGPVGPTDSGYCYDVNADAMVTALDALLVLNEMNRIKLVDGTVGSDETKVEGEKSTARKVIAPLAPGAEKDVEAALPSGRGDEPVAKTREDHIFGQWGSDGEPGAQEPDTQELSDSSPPTASSLRDRSRASSVQSTNESFAENVDQTLRLLSDRSS